VKLREYLIFNFLQGWATYRSGHLALHLLVNCIFEDRGQLSIILRAKSALWVLLMGW